MTEIENLFKPTSASVRQLVADQVGGFEIPPYQRPYRWKPADIRRLIEDVISSMNRIADDPNSVTFIGALITLSGVAEEHPSQPKEVRRVIDGQQRLTTLSLLAVALRIELAGIGFVQWLEQTRELDEDEEVEAALDLVDALREEAVDLQENLMDCIVDTLSSGKDEYKHRPKIIRDMADRWGKKPQDAQYLSPIAHLLFGYVRSVEAVEPFRPALPTKKVLPEAVGSSVEDHETLHRRFKDVGKYVRQMKTCSERDLNEFIDDERLIGGHGVAGVLFRGELKRALADKTAFTTAEDLGFPALEVVRLVAFTECLLDRIVLTQINASEEAYAFDMFDSLNSTGEPLTAFETFVPQVVRAESETGDSYSESHSFHHMSVVNKHLANASSVQRETAQFLTAFILTELGTKVGSSHNDQRAWLQRNYGTVDEGESVSSIDDKRQFTRSMMHTATAYFDLWKDGRIRPGVEGEPRSVEPDAGLCLSFLKQTNHRVAIAPLSRFVAQFANDPSDKHFEELNSVIRGCTAFSVLWRAAHGGTDGIDARYRSLMADGYPSLGLAPLSRAATTEPLPTAAEVCEALRAISAGAASNAYSDKESWIARARSRPIYDENEALTRFLLLVASHHAIPDDAGLTKTGAKSDATDMLHRERWSDEGLASIEHVAPRSQPKEGWLDEVYSDPTLMHTLGNLTLLPLDDNASVSNRSWEDKRWLYQILGAESPDEAKTLADEARSDGVKLSNDRLETLLNRRRHLPLLRAVAALDGDWSKAHVEQRTDHLLGLCWDRVGSWLGY